MARRSVALRPAQWGLRAQDTGMVATLSEQTRPLPARQELGLPRCVSWMSRASAPAALQSVPGFSARLELDELA